MYASVITHATLLDEKTANKLLGTLPIAVTKNPGENKVTPWVVHFGNPTEECKKTLKTWSTVYCLTLHTIGETDVLLEGLYAQWERILADYANLTEQDPEMIHLRDQIRKRHPIFR